MKQPETEIYKALSKYLQLKHPNVIFRFDFAAGTKMTVGQAKRHKAINPHRGYPDLFIAEPKGGWNGLFLEIKAVGSSPYLKDGSLSTNSHVQEQYMRLLELATKGYRADFVVGLDDCVEKIEAYLGGLPVQNSPIKFDRTLHIYGIFDKNKPMKKIIDIPDEIVKDLKIVAVKNDTDLKNYIQDLILNQYQITKVTEMAQNAIANGQSTRFVWNYLSETFQSIKSVELSVDKVKFETMESFVEHVKYVCEIMLESIKTENNA